MRAVNQFTTIDGEQVVDLTPGRATSGRSRTSRRPTPTIVSVTFLGPIRPGRAQQPAVRVHAARTTAPPAFELEFECSLDGGPCEGCDTPFHYVPLEELAGGDARSCASAPWTTSATSTRRPAAHTFTTEGEPETTILTGPAAEIDSTEATFTFSSDQAGATFECSLDLAPVRRLRLAASPSPTCPYGEHELQVRARSPLGTAST